MVDLKVGNFILESGYDSGNQYIWEIMDRGESHLYTVKCIKKILVNESKQRSVKVGGLEKIYLTKYDINHDIMIFQNEDEVLAWLI